MAIDKKLICFARLEEFERQLAAGNILGKSIVFIQDAKKIWNWGTYYDCNNVIPDWNAGEGEEGYIKNRTHFRIKDEFIATLDAGDGGTVVLNGTLPFLIENTSLLEGQQEIREVIVSKLDTEFEIPSIGPSIKAKITHDGTNYIYEQLTTYGVSNILNFYHSRVTPLQDWAIPDTIVRNTDLVTINGQSLTEGGDIAIDQPYITDFTVNDLLTLAEEEGAIQARIDMLYDALSAHKVILVPYDANEGFQGYAVANGYREDLLYLTVAHADGWVYLDLAHDRNEILSSMVTLLNWSNKQDKLVSGTNIKTINGESILGSGNIEIESGGEANVQSDWLETNESLDSYVKNRTHYVAGTKITSAGSYSIGASTPIYYREKVYNLEIGVRTQIESNASGVYVTLENGGILRVEDAANLLGSFPIIAVSEIVPLDDMFIPETIARTSELKTINGESIVGSGDIVIEGGASEDIRYFTEFTFDEFRNACKNGSDISSNGLYDAIINNKLICIPNGDAGYIVSGSNYTDNQSWSERHSFTLEVEVGQITYIAGIDTDDLTMDSLEGSTLTKVVQVEQLTSPKEDGSYLDNKTYIISNTVNELVVNFRKGYLGTTICFTTGDDPMLEIVGDVLWANGAAPEIEANTAYELSLRADDNNNVLAVLVPFKSV